jgi:opacity protein-like surface antigen
MIFARAFALLLAASAVSAELTQVALEAARTNPQLRAKETERQTSFLHKVRDLAVPKTRALADQDQTDDGYSWNQYMENDDFGFNMAAYSFKYTGCSTVQAFSDDFSSSGADNVLGRIVSLPFASVQRNIATITAFRDVIPTMVITLSPWMNLW